MKYASENVHGVCSLVQWVHACGLQASFGSLDTLSGHTTRACACLCMDSGSLRLARGIRQD